MSFLLYGANGYTGKLIIQKALQQGLRPILAGRSESKIKPLAEAYNLPFLVFSLDNISEVAGHLQNFSLVLNCAGPFSQTARPMVEACLLTKTHYLDITGEIEVFETIKSYHWQAQEKGIVLMPGVGFDVVPTDCLAVYLNEKLPDATHLELAICSLGGSISHGTLSTMIEGLGKMGAVRENGKIITQPLGQQGKWINFGREKKFAVTIPWGDVSTAYTSTGISNIKVYAVVPQPMFYILKLQGLFNPLLRSKLIKSRLQQYVDKKVTGPSQMQNQQGKSLVWGQVSNGEGIFAAALLQCSETYLLTAETALNIVRKLLNQHDYSGYYTPASLFGSSLILETPGTRLTNL
ncbi:membrane protein [Adhaeribacter aerolatus]|uniref:Membrane protein n=1 Tax=Adhaeribacter aerolatus TaxID=670289 RepID=A0A512AXC6_9BACT|nr:saccharopine dehydrogenase NADP-binding domain-containing protein [Adhaeribacter aerolatus]GEO04375.1 membrane protein [Adhaeribacter aerolatus]